MSILSQFRFLLGRDNNQRPKLAEKDNQLPSFVRKSLPAMRYLHLLSPLDWENFPERHLDETRGKPPIPYAPFVASCLIKLDQKLAYMSDLRNYLLEHPALIWLLGFPAKPCFQTPWFFDPAASLPTHRHFTRMLREIPNSALQFLLKNSVSLLREELGDLALPFGETVSLDTKHIIAWVKENNPKAYLSDRYKKEKQPKGDPDCRLGCKRKRNQNLSSTKTPLENAVPASSVSVGEYYWGYASGIVATKVPGWGELVLAELTQSFDHSDVSYFLPLMDSTEKNLGFRPKYGAFDAAYDAFYVYEYFHSHEHDGFAAVPFSQKGGHQKRLFSPEGLPLCTAGLAMPLKFTFADRTRALVEHQRGKYICPFVAAKKLERKCPVQDERWEKGGCTADLPTSIGARLRHQIDRESEIYKAVYKQRSATERINAQATAFGIERPKIRNGQAIANQNTLIYVLINLRALHRIRAQKSRAL